MTEQEKFEKWVEEVGAEYPEIHSDERGLYSTKDWCWAAWQAALASRDKK